MIAEISYFYLNIIWESASGSVNFESLASEQMKIFSKGEYVEMIKERIRHGRHVYIETASGWSAFAVYAQTMLLGYLAGRKNAFQNIDANLIHIKRISVISLLFGLGTGLIYSYGKAIINPSEVTPFRVYIGICFNLSRISLSIFYIAAIALLCHKSKLAWLFKWLSATGRMALTNYIGQSLICTSLFYSYGVGLFGKIGPSVSLVIAIGIYTFQVIYSVLWLKYFQFGPLEWIWRALTYGIWPKIKSKYAFGG